MSGDQKDVSDGCLTSPRGCQNHADMTWRMISLGLLMPALLLALIGFGSGMAAANCCPAAHQEYSIAGDHGAAGDAVTCGGVACCPVLSSVSLVGPVSRIARPADPWWGFAALSGRIVAGPEHPPKA